MKKWFMFIIIMVTMICGARLYPVIPQAERDALIALYNSTAGDNWTDNTNWRKPGDPTQFNDPGTESTWFGVTLTPGQMNVERIELVDNNLVGTIPVDLSALGQLKILDLGANELGGTIPDFTGLAALEVLDLSGNSIGGALPASLNNLTALTTLDVSGNGIYGNYSFYPMPDLGGLTNLAVLDLSSNNFSVDFPTWIGNLTQLTSLDLSYNIFSGTIPDLGSLTQLQYLELKQNIISGSIPASLNQLYQLKEIDLSSNNFSGTLPDLGNLTQLTALRLSFNDLSGTIPTGLNNLTNLTELDLNYNQFTGTIPDLSSLTNLTSLKLGNNQLGGEIPAWSGSLTDLQTLYLGDNQLTGTIPDLSNLTQLRDLRLGSNQLTGSFPAWIGNLTSLRYLYIHYNQLQGPIPSSIGNLTELWELQATKNQLEGNIPPEIGNLTKMRYLYLGDNKFSGSIPPEIGSLTLMYGLRLYGNQLTGSIPGTLSNLTYLTYNGLDLRWNGLYTGDSQLDSFIDSKHAGDWQSTQTVAPEVWAAAVLSATSVRLSWFPIPYIEDSGGYRVYYSTTSGSGYQEAYVTANKTTTSYTFTGLQPYTTYYFVVKAFTDAHADNQNAIVSEFSNEMSAYTQEPKTITVISPNGCERWHGGDVYPITWSSTGDISNVKIEYTTDDGWTWHTIVSSTANDGSYDWTVPETPADWCIVQISDTGGSAYDMNDTYFSIIEPVLVTDPDGFESWEVGTVHDITWSTRSGIANVKIEYTINNGGSWSVIEASAPNTGTYSWTIPNTPSYFCKVKISNTADPAMTDTSNSNFTIPVPKMITVTAPNGGENWEVGTVQDITWGTTGDISYVKIEYSIDNGNNWSTISSLTTNDGSYNWTIPGTTSSDCLVKISDVYGTSVDTGDSVFTIFIPMIPTAERDALIALYNSTDGDNWNNNTNWRKPGDPLQFNDPGTEHTWYGITCNAGKTAVLQIDLNGNNLVGTIPDLSDLTQLTSLKLRMNNLTGNIPTQIDYLANLTELDLGWNSLTGTIPDLSGLANLSTLKLDANRLTGSIPAWLNGLTGLATLELSNNQFSGAIPDLSGLSQLTYLNLGFNQLTGTIPTWLNQLTTLTTLDLNSNQLSGMIPDLSGLTALKYLYLYSNQLTGDIPSGIGNLTNLEDINLSGNQLTGTIPDISGLTQLRTLDLGENQLTGSIPAWLGNMTALLDLKLDNNQLNGSIPPELGNLSALKYLYLSDNGLTGNIPAEIGNLTALNQLRLEGNQLTGSLPGTLADLTNLLSSGLDLRWNGLYTDDAGLRNFLNSKQIGGNWESTQTTAPAGPSTSEETHESVKISWTPISYQGDSGGYRVYYSTTPGSGYTSAGTSADKSSDNYTVTGLDADTTYYFVVESFTGPHANNQNTVTSEYSTEVSASTLAEPTITVTAPNGSENWEGGTNHNITWTSTGSITNVKIEYSTDNGGLWNTVIASTANSGSYNWTVPNTPSTTCLVRISDTAGPASDISNAAFTISEQRTVTVTAPNGGQRWFIDSTYPITWLSTGSIASVMIEYSTNSGDSWNTITGSTANSGTYNWTIPNTPSTNCLVRVSDISGPAADVSNAVFTIDPYPTITVSSPNDGEIWDAGVTQNQTITWTYTGTIANVDIDYSSDGGALWNSIASSVPNTGSYNWVLPAVDSNNCLVRISDTVTSASDMSDAVFTIWQLPSITVTAPDGGESWQRRTVHTITWTTTGNIQDVKIQYSQNAGGYWYDIVSSTANDGSYQWTVPNVSKTATQCLVRIMTIDGTVVDTSNNYFTILK